MLLREHIKEIRGVARVCIAQNLKGPARHSRVSNLHSWWTPQLCGNLPFKACQFPVQRPSWHIRSQSGMWRICNDAVVRARVDSGMSGACHSVLLQAWLTSQTLSPLRPWGLKWCLQNVCHSKSSVSVLCYCVTGAMRNLWKAYRRSDGKPSQHQVFPLRWWSCSLILSLNLFILWAQRDEGAHQGSSSIQGWRSPRHHTRRNVQSPPWCFLWLHRCLLCGGALIHLTSPSGALAVFSVFLLLQAVLQ